MSRSTKWLPLFHKFISNLRIQSKDDPSDATGQGTPLVLMGSQERFLQNIAEGLENNQRTFYCLKSRQLGVTTISLAIDLFFLAMYPGTRGALVVDEDRNRDSFRNILKMYISSFPDGFFGDSFGIKKGGDNRFGLKFTNNSQLDFLVAGLKEKESFGDGGGYSLMHSTETGRYGCPSALTSFQQALSEKNPNRLYIYESRAAGPNHWQDMWRQGAKDFYTIRRFFIGWWSRADQMIPKSDPRWTAYGTLPPDAEERELIAAVSSMYGHEVTREQLAWYRWRANAEDISMDTMRAQQPWTEEEAFVTAGITFFHSRMLIADSERLADPDQGDYFQAYRYEMGDSFFETKIEEMFEDSDQSSWQLRVWEHPVKGAKYVIGMDPAFGRNDNKNNHAISVFRCYADKLVQVAEYASDDDVTLHAAWVLCHLAGNYEDCLVNLEVTGPGAVVMQELDILRGSMRRETAIAIQRERKIDDFLMAARWYVYSRPDSTARPGGVLNFKTGYESKRRAFNHLKNAHYDKTLVIRSRPLVYEMLSVRMHAGDIGAVGKNNDDRVMAAALAATAYKEWRQRELVAQNYFYDQVSAQESDNYNPARDPVGLIVRNYLKLVEQREEEAEFAEPTGWAAQRGLG